ncbi:MAG: hypothetical protein ACI80V_001839 [Rhodothermales bacterium]|jgi:hypothetical protein
MTKRAVSSFKVTGWEQKSYGEEGPPHLSRATVTKEFLGHLEADSTAELLLCTADASDLSAGAGYIANEVISGTLHGKRGAFVLQHGGLSGGIEAPRTFGSIVPGSGSEELADITGTSEMAMDADGNHTLVLNYDLPE